MQFVCYYSKKKINNEENKIKKKLKKYIYFYVTKLIWSCELCTNGEMFLPPLKHKMLFGSFSKDTEEHDHKVLRKYFLNTDIIFAILFGAASGEEM